MLLILLNQTFKNNNEVEKTTHISFGKTLLLL